MKSQILKSCFLLPVIWFATYVAFAVFGGLATIFGASDAFYCTVYCRIGLAAFLIVTGVFVAYQGVKCIHKHKEECMKSPA